MSKLELNSSGMRRARTRSLIQIGGLVDKSGLLETFNVVLGKDLQQDPAMKEGVAAFFKGLLVLNDIATSDEIHRGVWTQQGLEVLAKSKNKKDFVP